MRKIYLSGPITGLDVKEYHVKAAVILRCWTAGKRVTGLELREKRRR